MPIKTSIGPDDSMWDDFIRFVGDKYSHPAYWGKTTNTNTDYYLHYSLSREEEAPRKEKVPPTNDSRVRPSDEEPPEGSIVSVTDGRGRQVAYQRLNPLFSGDEARWYRVGDTHPVTWSLLINKRKFKTLYRPM